MYKEDGLLVKKNIVGIVVFPGKYTPTGGTDIEAFITNIIIA